MYNVSRKIRTLQVDVSRSCALDMQNLLGITYNVFFTTHCIVISCSYLFTHSGLCLQCFDCGITTSSKACNRTQRPVWCERNEVCSTIRYHEDFQESSPRKYTFIKRCMERPVCEQYCSLLPFKTVDCLVSFKLFIKKYRKKSSKVKL